jgi:hypothetical protein
VVILAQSFLQFEALSIHQVQVHVLAAASLEYPKSAGDLRKLAPQLNAMSYAPDDPYNMKWGNLAALTLRQNGGRNLVCSVDKFGSLDQIDSQKIPSQSFNV